MRLTRLRSIKTLVSFCSITLLHKARASAEFSVRYDGAFPREDSRKPLGLPGGDLLLIDCLI
jgi:hypothetical protein